jgi:4-alpha-glucanotransferase
MEAERAGAALIGEDLGTVEPEVRAALGERGVSGYRVAWFESDRPESWPERSVAMLTTHDLPTVAGVVTGTDETDRVAAGLAPDPDDLELLRGRLARLIGHPLPAPAAADADATTRVVLDAYDRLGHAGSDLVLASLEDAMLVEHRPNLPGTTTEHPNWSLALPSLIDAIDTAAVDHVARTLDRARRD